MKTFLIALALDTLAWLAFSNFFKFVGLEWLQFICAFLFGGAMMIIAEKAWGDE